MIWTTREPSKAYDVPRETQKAVEKACEILGRTAPSNNKIMDQIGGVHVVG